MSEPLPLGLAQQEKARPMDPDQLEQLGKKAAALYATGTPLTEAVVETIKEAMLSPEQVKRVCEFANTTAYLSEFEKAGSVRNVTFTGGPANPARVLQDLNDGSSPTLTNTPDYKTASVPSFRQSSEMEVLAQVFQCAPEGLNKTASAEVDVHEKHANVMDDLWDTRGALDAVRDDLVGKVTGAQLVFDDVRNQLCKTAEQMVMEGATLGEIAQIFAKVASNQEYTTQAVLAIRDHFVAHGHSASEMSKSFSKTAATKQIPNPEHPLVVQFSAFIKAAHAVKVVDLALADVNSQISSMNHAVDRLFNASQQSR